MIVGGNGAEGYQELVVNCLSVVEKQSDNLLNAAILVYVELL
jgi:hypothetical protein